MGSPGRQEIALQLRRAALAGARMVELIELVHDLRGVAYYSRGAVLPHFADAFGFGPRDFSSIVFACVIFGDGASLSVDEANAAFRRRLETVDL